ncbi:MAG: ABC transporter permease subunit [Oscillospiraceae bacterium]
MLNLLRSELYKMTRSKSFWICLIVCAGLAVFSAISIYASISMMDQMLGSASLTGGGTDLFAKMGMDAFQQVADLGKQASGLWFGVYAISTQYFQVIAAIFVSIWIGGEFKTGTMRFPVSKGFDRISVYGAKLLVAVIASSCSWSYHGVHWQQARDMGRWKPGGRASRQAGCHAGRAGAADNGACIVFVLLATLFRSSGASVAVNICL